MKKLTPRQMLDAFDRALAEAAKIAAQREADTVARDAKRKGAAEDPAKYESDKH